MKPMSVLWVLLAASPAVFAQTSDNATDTSGNAAALDLKLPPAKSIYAQDPPGAFYGDTSGRPALALTEPVRRNACGTPLEKDDGKATVHGSVAMGIGHTEGRGTSHWNAANINLCKAYTTDEGNSGAFNFNIGVSDYDGPSFGPYYGRGGGYGYRRAPGDAGPPPVNAPARRGR